MIYYYLFFNKHYSNIRKIVWKKTKCWILNSLELEMSRNGLLCLWIKKHTLDLTYLIDFNYLPDVSFLCEKIFRISSVMNRNLHSYNYYFHCILNFFFIVISSVYDHFGSFHFLTHSFHNFLVTSHKLNKLMFSIQ
jgi:hypothetical protein